MLKTSNEPAGEEIFEQFPLCIFVGEVVEGLEDRDLEHEQGRIGLASGGSGILAAQCFFDGGEKGLPIHDAVQTSQGVAYLIELTQENLFIE